MKIHKFLVENIPALLYGEPSEKLYLYVHGRFASREAAGDFAQILNGFGYQVLSFDLPEHGDRTGEDYPCNLPNGIRDLRTVHESVRGQYPEISLFACSLGACFSLAAFPDIRFRKCLFLSPVLDMKNLIEKMMSWAGVDEARLQEAGEIPTEFGETLSWDYYRFVKDHPVSVWNSPTSILYGENDNLTDLATVEAFAARFPSQVTVMPGGEHYFHTPEQLAFLDRWIRDRYC